MSDHVWVELKMTPLEVEEQADGSLAVYARAEAQIVADEEAPHACWFCFVPLHPDTFHTDCPGPVR